MLHTARTGISGRGTTCAVAQRHDHNEGSAEQNTCARTSCLLTPEYSIMRPLRARTLLHISMSPLLREKITMIHQSSIHTQVAPGYSTWLGLPSFLFSFPEPGSFYLFYCIWAALCSMWDLFPDEGLNPRPLHWKHRVSTIGPPGSS